MDSQRSEEEKNTIMEAYAILIHIFLTATFSIFTYILLQDMRAIWLHRKKTGLSVLRYVWREFNSLFKEETQ